MECSEARRVLWPADSPRLSDREVDAALAHAALCPACQGFLESDRRTAQLIREACPRVGAPREVRERLYTTLARERAGAPVARVGIVRSRLVGVSAFGLAVVALAIIAFVLGDSRPGGGTASAFADDYLRRVVDEKELETADHERIAGFFARELGDSLPPPVVPEFEVKRAMICLMNGRRGGVVQYEAEGRGFSHYLVPVAETASPARTGEAGLDLPLSVSHDRGLTVATWRDEKHQHALVGDLTADQLQELAPLFACRTRGRS